MDDSSITRPGGPFTADETVGEAVRHYLEGRLEPAVRILERVARESPIDPLAAGVPATILRALETMARLDPQFRRERMALRKRLLVLTSMVERRVASSARGRGSPRA